MSLIKIESLTKNNMDSQLVRPVAGADREVIDAVKCIIDDVIARGDAALIDYTAQFDQVRFPASELRVTLDERDAALGAVSDDLIETLQVSARRIRDFHSNQLPKSWMTSEDGIMLGQQVTSIGRAGLYVPGGLANYPSSVLMNAIPAQIAGVSEIVLCVPPDKDGNISKYTLAAAAVIGIDEIYKVGGAQVIAAMAYGTDSIKSVDKITGPGNIFVATAKKLVVGAVDIDMIAGPTEVVIVADKQARADFVAADMIAQAEHDPMSSAILLTDDPALAAAVETSLESQLGNATRASIARRSLSERGRIYMLDDLRLAVDFVNSFAPEHLEIMTADARDWLPEIKNAGAIFLGSYTPEALGDYVAGANHVLPTGSTARFYSPLGVYDFIKWSSVLFFDKEGLMKFGPDAVRLADAEGLDGHSRSVRVRMEGQDAE